MSHTDGFEKMRDSLSELQRAVEHVKEAFDRYDEKLNEALKKH